MKICKEHRQRNCTLCAQRALFSTDPAYWTYIAVTESADSFTSSGSYGYDSGSTSSGGDSGSSGGSSGGCDSGGGC